MNETPGAPAGGGSGDRGWTPGADPLVRGVFALLVLACLGAFFITQRLKHTPTPVQDFKRTPRFSPYPAAHNKLEQISFKLDRAEAVTVTVLDTAGTTVATLLDGYAVPRYKQFSLRWNGRTGRARGYSVGHTASGRAFLVPHNRGPLAAAGEYRVRVTLRAQGRSVESPWTLHAGGPVNAQVAGLLATKLPGAGELLAGGRRCCGGGRAARRCHAPLCGELSAARRGGTALPRADRNRRQDRQPADPALPRRGCRHARTDHRVASRPRARARAGTSAPRRLSSWATPRGLEALLLLAVVLYVLQALYSADLTRAAENVGFFYLPFGLLFVLLARVRWTRALLAALPGRARRARRAVRGGRVHRVCAQVAVPQPEGRRGQPVRQLLPRQLVVLRPEHLRPFPRARDDRAEHDGDVELAPSRCPLRGRRCSPGCSRASSRASRSRASPRCCSALAVLAAWRWDPRRTLYVSLALLALAAAVVAARPNRSALRAEGHERLDQQCHQRPYDS